MRIHNTKELVRRADWHAANDHIVQGTYAEGIVNGHADFRGCAIGCLATPHTKRGLTKWLRHLADDENNRTSGDYFAADEGDSLVFEHGYVQVDRLADEFGIDPTLMRCAEWVFEQLPTHEEAIEFIPAFARALPEGHDVDRRLIQDFWEGATNGFGWVDVECAAGGRPNKTNPVAVRRIRDELLGWLRAMAAVPVVSA